MPTDCLYLKNMSVAYISSRRKDTAHIDLSENKRVNLSFIYPKQADYNNDNNNNNSFIKY